jgi:pilus assembly protein CpaB
MFLRNVLLAVGAAFVLLGVVVLVAWFGQARKSPGVVETRVEGRASVLVAAQAISTGTLLRQEDFKSKELGPDELLQPGSLVAGQEKEFLGALSRRDFAEGDPLIASEFVKPNDRRFLAAVLHPGNRAVTILVDAAQSVAGLALPDDHVDVVLTLSFEEKDTITETTPTAGGTATVSAEKFLIPLGLRTAGETVLQGVRVIAVDQSLNPPSATVASVLPAAGAEARIPKTVTLEVGERDAEKLLVAEKLGSFQLVVRPLEVAATDPPEDKRNNRPVWASDVSQAIRRFSAPRPQAAVLASREMSVRVYSGGSGSNGYLCSKSSCVPSDVNTVTSEAASRNQNPVPALPIELR